MGILAYRLLPLAVVCLVACGGSSHGDVPDLFGHMGQGSASGTGGSLSPGVGGAAGSATTLGGRAGTAAGTGGSAQAGSATTASGGSPVTNASGGSPVTDAGGAPDDDPNDFPPCGKLDPSLTDCTGLATISLESPDVSAFTDGSIEQGDGLPISVWVQNSDTVTRSDVCVGLAVNVHGIAITDYSDEGPSPTPDADPVPIGGVASMDTAIVTPFYANVLQTAPAGATATFTFWPGLAGTKCVGPSVRVDALIRAAPSFP